METGFTVQNITNWCICTIVAYIMVTGLGIIQPCAISWGQKQLVESFLIINFISWGTQKSTKLKQRDQNSDARSNDQEAEKRNNRLLLRDGSKYLVHHQDVVRSIVLKYVASGLYNSSETDDVIQYINECMLTGVLKKIQSQYKPWRCNKTYFYKIVSNLCLQYAKNRVKRNRYEKIVDFTVAQFGIQETISTEIILREIYRKLGILLNRYGSNRPRIELLLKISLRVGITKDDVLQCYPSCCRKILGKFLLSFNHAEFYRLAKDGEVYRQLVTLMTELEGKNKSGDAIRKFVNSKFDEIADILNKPPINAALTRETAKLLLEYYYAEFPESLEKTI